MRTAIDYLEQRKDAIKDELKNGRKNENLLIEIKEISDGINWLKKINELKLKNVQKYEIIELPDMKTGWSFYRIMNDCETDDRNDWIELNIPVKMCMGDILMISKP